MLPQRNVRMRFVRNAVLVVAGALFLVGLFLSITGTVKGQTSCTTYNNYRRHCRNFFAFFWAQIIFEFVTAAAIVVCKSRGALRSCAVPLVTFLAISTMGLMQITQWALMLVTTGGEMPFTREGTKIAAWGFVVLMTTNLAAVVLVGYSRHPNGYSMLEQDELEQIVPLVAPGRLTNGVRGVEMGFHAPPQDFELPSVNAPADS